MERGEGHIIPESRVMLEGMGRFLEGPEGLLKFSLLVKSQAIVIENLGCLL
jgi:hypothetical protein